MIALEKYANVKVSCSNEELGCPWKGLLKDLDDHSGPCEKNLFRNAIIDIHMLKGALEQKDREVHHLKNDFALKIEKLSKERFLKKKEKLEKVRDQTERFGEILFAKVEEVREENLSKNEEIEHLKNEVEELKKSRDELQSEIQELREENQKCSKQICKQNDELKRVQLNIKDGKSDLPAASAITDNTVQVNQVPQESALLPKTTKVYFDMAVSGNTIGRIEIDLFLEKAPNNCTKFLQHINRHKGISYEGSSVYEIDDKYCYIGSASHLTFPTDARKYPDEYKTPPENLSDKHKERGLVSIIQERNTNVTYSGFMVTLKAFTKFDGNHVIIGKVSNDTWHVVEKIIKKEVKTVLIADCGVLA